MKNFKRNAAAMGILIAAICLTGCSASVISLNDNENKAVARYIADKLLQNDINYKKTQLVYMEPAIEQPSELHESVEPAQGTEEPTQEPAQPPVTDSTDSSETSVDGVEGMVGWDEFFTTDEWSIKYSTYDTYKSYPADSDVYTIDASEGNQLLVLFFDVKNLTDEKIKIDLSDAGLKYKFYIGQTGYSPCIAVLENGGLLYLKTSIPAGKTGRAELIFEVPEGIELRDMRLDVSK